MINFNEPLYGNKEMKCIEAALHGEDYTNKAKNMLVDYYSNDNIYLTVNGSSAIEMAFAILDLPKGSEVIIPSFNYPSIANTILRCGLKPVFADVKIDDVIMSMDSIKPLVNEKTKLIVPVHYGGYSMDMNELCDFAKQNNIYVLEDAALSFGGKYKGEKLGTIADMGIVSFHKTKNISCDSGGILIINNETFIENASLIYNNGTNREEFYAGKADMYSWQHIGFSIEMPNVNAAILSAQLKKRDKIAKIRKGIYNYYSEALMPLVSKYNLVLPKSNDYNKENYHVYHILFPDKQVREQVRLYLKSKDIHAHTHYVPLHLSDMGKKLGYSKGDLPNTEDVFDRLLRLPLHNKMTVLDAKNTVDSILEVL